MSLSHAEASQSLDLRVEDYLDDKLQSMADLDTLDELLVNVETQRNQLQSQLDDAVRELEKARRTTEDRSDSLQQQIDEFNELQASIDTRVKIAAASDAPSEAIARLQRPMKKLQHVELAQKYLILLQDVERLRAEARSYLPDSPKAALEPYAKLKGLALKLRSLSGNEELHLVDHVQAVTESLWNEMKKTMSAELEGVLEKRHWPKVDPHAEMDDEWIACVEKLIDLQMPEITRSSSTLPLLPFNVMTAIFVAEFRFHFMSDKPTSNPQSIGTHCFPWFLTMIEKWEDFFRNNLGHLLATKFHETPVAENTVYLDPVSALITAMLPVMRGKVHAVANEAIKNPPFLSSFISQLMTFDENIRQRFSYDDGDDDKGWNGLTGEILDHHFDAWFRVEREFALERFEKIIESADGRKIDYDYSVTGKMKPTFAAVRITDLLRVVTGKYERLRKLKHKTKFLTDIQLDILDGYHDRLRGSLEAYQSITSTLGRTLHGASKEQLAALEGIGALETLCKVIGSSDHIANTLTEWSDEEFFVVLWEDLQTRDAQRSKRNSAASGIAPDSILGRVPSHLSDNGSSDSGIFDETVSAYSSRRKAAEQLLVNALVDSHAKAFRAYASKVQWTTVGDAAVLDDPSQFSISPELDEPLRILQRNFDYLTKALSTASFRRVWHEALDKLQDLLWTSVLLKQSFTTLGAAQFAHDGGAVFSLVERYIPGGSGALDSLREGMQLLNLATAAPADSAEGRAPGLTLKEASDRVFTDNDEARKVLEELGLHVLTPVNARYILQRRVENNENIGW
ncbi:RINT-1/TIP-1 family protein [Metarhizium robertsii]|uniref:RINT-1 family protein n=2 Tax=Metarhizium robertsii TaxID=568076 RepID=E9EX37_METRA|nr:RINT-1 family protein [Metarhizium robertsii ARSEF 23]EFY99657.1 RINT-1 family protein [Metarhizium robertsii ARSEF 23]EXV06335.1 RINT-1/TIP-1 family protein [Metarhizium robertsii]